MADTLSTLSIIFFIASGVLLGIALILFFVFNIPSVIGDLSGRTAKNSIKKMRLSNESSGSKSYKTSETNAQRGKLTSAMPSSENKEATQEKQAPKTAAPKEQTETGLLFENASKMPFTESTELLDVPANEDIHESAAYEKAASNAERIQLTVIEEVMLIHTDEVI